MKISLLINWIFIHKVLTKCSFRSQKSLLKNSSVKKTLYLKTTQRLLASMKNAKTKKCLRAKFCKVWNRNFSLENYKYAQLLFFLKIKMLHMILILVFVVTKLSFMIRFLIFQTNIWFLTILMLKFCQFMKFLFKQCFLDIIWKLST